ncbi:MAG: Cysteine synthase [Dehalococcoidia bacterium]|nr:Cysteine synthase [Dehalococcoidia bacterium]
MQPKGILDYVGNTPLVEISRMSPKPGVRIFAKLEGYNPTGSIKDRVAGYMIRDAEEKGILRPGQTLIEASTGNTAMALALIAKQRGYKMKAVVSTKATPGMAELLEMHDVEVIWCEPLAGMKGAIDLAKRLSQEKGWFTHCQFESQANVLAHYETTGPEILRALPEVDVFIAGIGTGGTLMGVGQRLKEHNPQVKVIGVEPRMGDPLQGLRSLEEGYIPPLLDLARLDGRFLVDSRAAFACARAVLEVEGIFAGVSSGAVLHCAQRMAERMERGNIVVIFADGGWKYLASGPWREAAQARVEHPDDMAWW